MSVLKDIFVSRRQAADAARKAQMIDSFESAGLGYFWSTDAQGNIDYLTPSAFSNLGWNRKAVTGTPISNHLLPAEDPDKGNERPLSFLLSARNSITGLTVKLKTDIGDVWWEISGKPQFDAS
ncbi:MAG: PAS domain-containing protein, partial [Altererythrobacter ishigakiensis]|nr:PAS domain-containing protein [Altererythrobacter ishigakiensis]